jgi:hypothetical protein
MVRVDCRLAAPGKLLQGLRVRLNKQTNWGGIVNTVRSTLVCLVAIACTSLAPQVLADPTRPILNADFVSGADQAQAMMQVKQLPDGTATGGGMWLYPNPDDNLIVTVDQAYVGPDGLSVSFSGWLTTGLGDRYRYIGRLYDNGEGKKAVDVDRETYLVISTNPAFNLDDPDTEIYLGDPAFWGLAEWFPVESGNIQVRSY